MPYVYNNVHRKTYMGKINTNFKKGRGEGGQEVAQGRVNNVSVF